jgi:hypothetical protein
VNACAPDGCSEGGGGAAATTGGGGTLPGGGCKNGERDGTETDVDCGGEECSSCAQGQKCSAHSDCAGMLRADGVCCNTPCDGLCQACAKVAGGIGPDGTCSQTALCGSPLAAGLAFTCAVTPVGTVKCWGFNNNGQLGEGTTQDSATPVSAGFDHSCARRAQAGSVVCWGAGSSGQLGNGLMDDQTTPSNTGSLTNVVALASGDAHTCALLKDGTARCWGANFNGQLGDGTKIGSVTPVTVAGFP